MKVMLMLVFDMHNDYFSKLIFFFFFSGYCLSTTKRISLLTCTCSVHTVFKYRQLINFDYSYVKINNKVDF